MNAAAAPNSVAVIGAGITGLTAAFRLRQAGFSPVVFEAASRVGGVIGAVRSDGWLHELGPNSLLEGSAEVAALVDDVGLGSRRLYAADAARQRYIVRAGRMVAMPTSPLAFVTTPLFSLRAKLALLGEPLRPKAPAEIEETVADFVVRRLGQEFLDYAINPFVGGVYAGDPRRLSVQHGFPKLHALEQAHGSLIRGALKRRNTSGGPKGRIFSFPGGLEELPRTLAAGLGSAVRLNTRVESLRRTENQWQLAWSGADGPGAASFAHVVVALPADALAGLKFEGVVNAPDLTALRAIVHPPVASVFTGFARGEVTHPLDGFGVLMPEVEQGKILGSLFSSTLFPGRAPEGCVALTTFVGGVRQPELAQLGDDALLELVLAELRRLVGVRAAPRFVHVRRWPRAIPQYAPGYARFKELLTRMEQAAPGLHLGGNARDGISLANCIESGLRLAASVQRLS
jgi:oxygen-dependent protoporphyrinogen oxidase